MPLPIIDSHVHLWNPNRFPMPWLKGNVTLERPFEPDAFSTKTAGLGIAGIVCVEVAPAYATLGSRPGGPQPLLDPFPLLEVPLRTKTTR